ncbi:hypothetical protein [Escherichia coli]|uniref:hypothetical protein n=1 Tax=Escherichia coli TaxID=562 RepID=UPI0013753FD4|nr:hypothetical protein [Escherichia coli]MBZ8439356.1 hypothetical protein [Escherichia coli]MCQ5796570.1 hypothetical protein [Escherichia coli]MCQ5801302.1 hypothetical protein [Escherichia coli]MCQ5806194.1 hypothetical protein [Escherichia coli]MCQ5810962.1 hypothetical protein [Escherichia coli]
MKNLHIKINFILFVAMITMKSNVYAADIATYKIKELSISDAFLASSGGLLINSYASNNERVSSVTSNTIVSTQCNGSNKHSCYIDFAPVANIENWGLGYNCQKVSGSAPKVTSYKVRNNTISWFDLSKNLALNKFYVAKDGIMNMDVEYAYSYSFDPEYTVQCNSNYDELTATTSGQSYATLVNENTGVKIKRLMGPSATIKFIRQGPVTSLNISPAVLSCNGIIEQIISCGKTTLNMSSVPSKLTVVATTNVPNNLELFFEDDTGKRHKIDNTQNISNDLSTTTKELKVYAKSDMVYQENISLNIEATWY